jgi:hypothetical protein
MTAVWADPCVRPPITETAPSASTLAFRPPGFLNNYSYLKASTGSRSAARLAG